jgi:hypothetical protein
MNTVARVNTQEAAQLAVVKVVSVTGLNLMDPTMTDVRCDGCAVKVIIIGKSAEPNLCEDCECAAKFGSEVDANE